MAAAYLRLLLIMSMATRSVDSSSCFVQQPWKNTRPLLHIVDPCTRISDCESGCLAANVCDAYVFSSTKCALFGVESGRRQVCVPTPAPMLWQRTPASTVAPTTSVAMPTTTQAANAPRTTTTTTSTATTLTTKPPTTTSSTTTTTSPAPATTTTISTTTTTPAPATTTTTSTTTTSKPTTTTTTPTTSSSTTTTTTTPPTTTTTAAPANCGSSKAPTSACGTLKYSCAGTACQEAGPQTSTSYCDVSCPAPTCTATTATCATGYKLFVNAAAQGDLNCVGTDWTFVNSGTPYTFAAGSKVYCVQSV